LIMVYKLRILNLKCYLSDEADGDEVYLESEGGKIWPTDHKFIQVTGEETAIGVDFKIQKGESMDIELWDYDMLSANDHLGRIVIQADAHGHFTNDFIKQGNDQSKYGLEWEIG
jgi:hypothetical protein